MRSSVIDSGYTAVIFYPGVPRKTIQYQNQQQADDTYHECGVESLRSPGGVRIKGLHQNAQPLEENRRAHHGKKIDAGHGCS